MTPRPLLLLALLALPVPAAAGALSDLLMAPNTFADAPAGSAIAYEEERAVPPGGTLTDVTGGEVRLEVRDDGAGGRTLRLVRVSGGEPTPVGSFPTGVANPLLLYFLETTVRATAEATGGSPYYIRNRIREALVASDLGEAPAAGPHSVTLAPFAGDPNRAKLGAFADLTLRIAFDPAEPGRILELSADTAGGEGGYHELMVLIGEN